jgi:hypothetical protein
MLVAFDGMAITRIFALHKARQHTELLHLSADQETGSSHLFDCTKEQDIVSECMS